jgi:DNA-binding transcriptional regulator YhcF (GntR family)
LLFTKRASGKTVTEDEELIGDLRAGLASARIEALLSAMEALGFSPEETRELFLEAQKAQKAQKARQEAAQEAAQNAAEQTNTI